MLATGAVDRLKRRSRPVNGPLSLTLDSVNRVFAILFHWLEKCLNSAGFAASKKHLWAFAHLACGVRRPNLPSRNSA